MPTTLGSRTSGALLVLSGTITVSAAQWVLVLLFGRLGGPADVGRYSFALSVATPLFIVAQFGLRNVYLTLRARIGFSAYLTIRIFTSAAAAAALIGIALTDVGPELAIAVPLSIAKILESLLDIFYAPLQFHGRERTFGTLMILNSVTILFAGGTTYLLTGSIALATWGTVLASAVTLFIAAVPAVRATHLDRIDEGHGHREIWAAALPLGVAQGLGALLGYLPVLFLGLNADPATVGLFSAAAYFATFANLLSSGLHQVLLPKLVHIERRAAFTELRRRTGRIWVAASFLGLGMGFVTAALGPYVLTLFFGPAFRLSAVDLLPVAAAVTLVPATYVSGMLLFVSHRYAWQVWPVATALAASCVYALTTGGVSDVVAAGMVLLIGTAGRAATGMIGVAKPMAAWKHADASPS